MQKKSTNFKFLRKIFFARNDPKRLIIRSQHHFCSPQKFQAGISQKRSWSFFKKSMTPDMQKSQKISNFWKKIFSLETT